MEKTNVMENEMVNDEVVTVDEVSTTKMSKRSAVVATGLVMCMAVGAYTIVKKVVGKVRSAFGNLKAKRASKKTEVETAEYTYCEDENEE